MQIFNINNFYDNSRNRVFKEIQQVRTNTWQDNSSDLLSVCQTTSELTCKSNADSSSQEAVNGQRERVLSVGMPLSVLLVGWLSDPGLYLLVIGTT